MRTFSLNDGGSIPAIGLGTYLSKKGEVATAVEVAIRAGYRHLDLALIYGNQAEVGAALKKVIPSVIKREELFVTTKLWNSNHHPEAAAKDLELSLKQLGLDYIDLYLMHWPIALKNIKSTEIDTSVSVAETWLGMRELQKTGKVKHIGVSNFTADHIKQLISATGIKPTVNQVELHPYLPQDDLLAYCAKEDVHITAYYPIGGQPTKKRPSLLAHPIIKEVAGHYPDATPAHVLLNWGLTRGYSVIPKSITPDRIRSNMREMTLSPEDTQKINSIVKTESQRFVFPIKMGMDIDVFGSEIEKKATHQVVISKPAAGARL